MMVDIIMNDESNNEMSLLDKIRREIIDMERLRMDVAATDDNISRDGVYAILQSDPSMISVR